MWKSVWCPALCVVILLLVGPIACSSSKGARKPEQKVSTADSGLISEEPDAVRKKFGEPTTVSRTVDGHILWVYQPSWKLLPNDKGTVYVEFDNNRVTKVFKIK
jgi:hypothetical protein